MLSDLRLTATASPTSLAAKIEQKHLVDCIGLARTAVLLWHEMGVKPIPDDASVDFSDFKSLHLHATGKVTCY